MRCDVFLKDEDFYSFPASAVCHRRRATST